MADNLDIVDGNALSTKVKTTESGGVHTPHQNAQIVDHNGDSIITAATGSILPVMLWEHVKVHEGKIFTASHKESGIANSASHDLLIKVPAGVRMHLRFFEIKTTDNPCDILLYSGPTTSADGNAVTAHNSDHDSDTSATVTIFEGPTVSAVGDEKHTDLIVAGKNAGGSFSDSGSEETILSAETNYLLRVTNNTGGAMDALHKVVWYEAV